MKKELKALAVVEKINDEIVDKQIEQMRGIADYEFDYPLLFESNGTSCGIKFMGETIWDSENFKDYDDDDKEIDLEQWVRDEIKRFVDRFNSWKL